MTRSLHVAVCGAAGLVGREILAILSERSFPCASITVLDVAGQTGVRVPFGETDLPVKDLSAASFQGIDIALFAVDDATSRMYAPIAQAAGCVVVDLSGAWRAEDRCPIVAANINFDALSAHNGIISCPSSSAIQLLAVLSHLHKAVTIKRVVVTSLQAVSGSGQEGIDELEHQVRQLFNMQSPEAHFFPHQIAFNCLPHIGEFTGNDATDEETNLAMDVQKLLGTDVQVTATCVLVPVFYGHSQSVTITTDKSISASEARVLLMQDNSIQVLDNPRASLYPLASDVSGEDEVFVGRIREAIGFDNTLNLWIAADNIRRGAALNAVLIAEELLQRDLVSVSAPGIFHQQ